MDILIDVLYLFYDSSDEIFCLEEYQMILALMMILIMLLALMMILIMFLVLMMILIMFKLDMVLLTFHSNNNSTIG